MTITEAKDAQAWDAFLKAQQFSPFLQSWTMGEVYKSVGQKPIRLEIRDGSTLVGICFGHIVPARRGKHLSIPYGPVLSPSMQGTEVLDELLQELSRIAWEEKCSFLRVSPFWPKDSASTHALEARSTPSPLHLLGEHIWYLPLTQTDTWSSHESQSANLSEDDLFKNFRATHRNLIRRAEKEGVTVEASKDPLADLQHFLTLHDETRKRHGFTPYTNSFFRAQVEHFAQKHECTLYLARYQGQVIASSIHMHIGGETSYHHGASTHAFPKIPASYLLQWTAIKDALKRGDHVYNFWGIAPVEQIEGEAPKIINTRHPFAGVTLFKTGFSGHLLNIAHCRDVPVRGSYWLTHAFERVRKWKRGF